MCTFSRFNIKVGTSEEGSGEVKNLFDGLSAFDYPKPVSLISYLISIIFNDRDNKYDNDYLVLDFFAGSATTSEAIMDINMPGLDGLSTLKKLREKYDIPVIIITGRRDTDAMQEAFELGADDFVRKPFRPTELLARIRAKLRRLNTDA